MATSAQAHGHLSTGTLPPGAAAGESAPARRALPANKSKACLHQARPWPTCPSKAPRGEQTRARWGQAPEEGPCSWSFSPLCCQAGPGEPRAPLCCCPAEGEHQLSWFPLEGPDKQGRAQAEAAGGRGWGS